MYRVQEHQLRSWPISYYVTTSLEGTAILVHRMRFVVGVMSVRAGGCSFASYSSLASLHQYTSRLRHTRPSLLSTSFSVLILAKETLQAHNQRSPASNMAPGIDNRVLNGISLPEADHRFLIWGGNGWVAGHLYTLLKEQGKRVTMTTVRMEDRSAVLAQLEQERPTHVLNCAGVTGRPNVDWCEENKETTIRSNVIGTLNLADCCYVKGIHCTVFATGCMSISQH